MSVDRFIGWTAGVLAVIALPLIGALYMRGMFRSAILVAFLCGAQTMSALLAFARDSEKKPPAGRA